MPAATHRSIKTSTVVSSDMVSDCEILATALVVFKQHGRSFIVHSALWAGILIGPRGDPMTRAHAFVAGIIFGLSSSLVEAQTVQGVARVGLLCATRCEGDSYNVFRETLRRTGWIEGRNLIIDQRAAGGRFEALLALARELVALNPHVLVTGGPQPSHAAKNATSSIPIVFIAVADPVRTGLVQSLARPGGNITGIATLVPGGFIAKQLELLKEAVPGATRIAVFANPTNEIYRATFATEVPPAAARLGVALRLREISTAEEIEPAIRAAVEERAQALLVIGDPLFHNPVKRIPELAATAGLPTMFLPRDLAVAGGLMSYGPDFIDISRRAATYVDQILKGAHPAYLPVDQPTRFQLILNLKTAKALGLAIPESILIQATEVIE
jgi:putative tryptophan/tyrosine transport system substrate-binding protein